MKTTKRRLGDLGEALATKLLVKNGFCIVERNFWRPEGEIDIIATKDTLIYFVEVKTVTYKTNNRGWGSQNPSENVSQRKLLRMRHIVSRYLLEKKIKSEWKFMVISVSVETLSNGKIRPLYNVFYDVL